MALTKEDILRQLRTLREADSGDAVFSSENMPHVAVCEGYIDVKISPSSAPSAGEQRDRLSGEIEKAVHALGHEVRQVKVEFIDREAEPARPQPHQKQQGGGGGEEGGGQGGQGGEAATPQQSARKSNPLPQVRHVIAIGAGKGGVGKSTVAVNLALGLARAGHRTGLLDGDIYGPSATTLLGLADMQPTGSGQTLFPFEVHGIKAMTIGKLVPPDKPLIWRGPMAHGSFRKLATQTRWGELDYLIVDLPPGTGDVPLTLTQMLPLTGAVIVCTPQKVAQDDAVRAANMFGQLEVSVLGVVENMSYFIGDDDKEYDIFGRGGAAEMASRIDVPLLGTIPIHMDLRRNSDEGQPGRNFESNPALAQELTRFAENLVRQVEQQTSESPTLSIS